MSKLTIGLLLPGGTNANKLSAAVRRAGHQPLRLHPDRLSAVTGSDGIEVRLRGAAPKVDVLIHYMAFEYLAGLQVLDLWDQTPMLNTPTAVRTSTDKWSSTVAFARAGVPQPKTALCVDPQDAVQVAGEFGFPVVIKHPDIDGGSGVTLAADAAQVADAYDRFAGIGRQVLVQEQIKQAFGTDYRLFVIGDEVVACMRRSAGRADEFRSNLCLGGSAQAHEPTAAQRDVALAATRAVGLDFAGVDLVDGPDGPLCIETNSWAGLKGIHDATGIDCADHIVALALSRLGQ